MNKTNKGFTLIEVLVVLAIIVTIGSIVLRIMYGADVRQWEDNLFKSVGLDPFIGRAICGLLVLYFVIRKAIADKKQRRY